MISWQFFEIHNQSQRHTFNPKDLIFGNASVIKIIKIILFKKINKIKEILVLIIELHNYNYFRLLIEVSIIHTILLQQKGWCLSLQWNFHTCKINTCILPYIHRTTHIRLDRESNSLREIYIDVFVCGEREGEEWERGKGRWIVKRWYKEFVIPGEYMVITLQKP